MPELPPLSLYLHLPWCVRKCPYCDFNSHTAGDSPPFEDYVDALLADLAVQAPLVESRPLSSVFLGGGTPSLFAPQHIARVLAGVRDNFALGDDIEITMEANPGTVEYGDPAGYRHAGVNRLSIGAQSFDDAMLNRLGRIHSSADIVRAVDHIRRAGFSDFNLDLMYALPGQDATAALADIEQAARLQPSHISWYQLTLEPNTVFHAQPPRHLPDNDEAADIQNLGQAHLHELGYAQYEVSAWARDGRHCAHNLNYWQFGDYLAAGAGAHGKLTRRAGPELVVQRYARPANPRQYLHTMQQAPELPDFEVLDAAARLFEFMLNALRLSAGFDTALFEKRTGERAARLVAALQEPLQRGLIERIDGTRWRPTALGFRFLNDLQACFLPE